MLDSVKVTQIKITKEFQPAYSGQSQFGPIHSPAYYYQNFSLLLTSYSGASEKDWFYGVAKSIMPGLEYYNNSDSAVLSLLEKDRTTDHIINYAFFYPLINFYSPQEKISAIPSIIVEGKNYSNVELYSNSNRIDTTDANFLRTTYYWAKGIGIIKREIKTSNSIKTYLLMRKG